MTEEAVIADGITLLYCKDGQKFPVCNSLLIRDEQTVLFDPGYGHHQFFEKIKKEVDLVLLTHFHADHICYANKFSCPVLIHQKDRPGLENKNAYFEHAMPEAHANIRSIWENYLGRCVDFSIPFVSDVFWDNQVFRIGKRSVRVIHLPGHSMGHCAFMIEPDNILFGGDIDPTFYPGSPGTLKSIFSSYSQLAALETGIFLTSHSRLPRKGNKIVGNYEKALMHRNEHISNMIKIGKSFAEIIEEGTSLMFNGNCPNPYEVWKYFGSQMVKSHLEWIKDNGF